jgi:hypothetical protein
VIAPHGGVLGKGRSGVPIDRSILTARSIGFDAVPVAAGTTPVTDIKTVILLQEAHRLGAWRDRDRMLQAAGIDLPCQAASPAAPSVRSEDLRTMAANHPIPRPHVAAGSAEGRKALGGHAGDFVGAGQVRPNPRGGETSGRSFAIEPSVVAVRALGLPVVGLVVAVDNELAVLIGEVAGLLVGVTQRLEAGLRGGGIGL